MVKNELTNEGTLKVNSYKAIIFILRYVAPTAILIIFVNELFLV